MRVSKRLAVELGFQLCASVFIALSAYGLFLYMDWGAPQKELSAFWWAVCAALLAGSIAGVVWLGALRDRLNREAGTRPPGGTPDTQPRHKAK